LQEQSTAKRVAQTRQHKHYCRCSIVDNLTCLADLFMFTVICSLERALAPEIARFPRHGRHERGEPTQVRSSVAGFARAGGASRAGDRNPSRPSFYNHAPSFYVPSPWMPIHWCLCEWSLCHAKTDVTCVGQRREPCAHAAS
jgi:hypothetical protein